MIQNAKIKMKNHNSKLKIGACGICCESCGLYTRIICFGCHKTKEGIEFLKNLNANCSVFECAVNNKIDVCSRDCDKFPCGKFEGWPLEKEWLEMFKQRLKSKK